METDDWDLLLQRSQNAEAFRSGDTVSPGAYKELLSNVVILLDRVQPLPTSDSGEPLWYIRLEMDYPYFTVQ
jgi:hypothetical protein